MTTLVSGVSSILLTDRYYCGTLRCIWLIQCLGREIQHGIRDTPRVAVQTLDNLVETRDRQIVDKDVDTGEWGLTEQIETSAPGHIPDDPQMLLQRMEAEHVRQALDRGCDRQKIMDVLSVSRRTTLNKHKRACAYDFPPGCVQSRRTTN